MHGASGGASAPAPGIQVTALFSPGHKCRDTASEYWQLVLALVGSRVVDGHQCVQSSAAVVAFVCKKWNGREGGAGVAISSSSLSVQVGSTNESCQEVSVGENTR